MENYLKLDYSLEANNIAKALIPGDQIDVVWVFQPCSDLNCCDIEIFLNIEGEIYQAFTPAKILNLF